jgi:hypothetical protein
LQARAWGATASAIPQRMRLVRDPMQIFNH